MDVGEGSRLSAASHAEQPRFLRRRSPQKPNLFPDSEGSWPNSGYRQYLPQFTPAAYCCGIGTLTIRAPESLLTADSAPLTESIWISLREKESLR